MLVSGTVSCRSFVLFSYCLAVHRDLHSFPTRRSSDLLAVLFVVFIGAEAAPAESAVRALWAVNDGEKVRSEEHTSELQSLTNLVCRLLLEKKKKTLPNCT